VTLHHYRNAKLDAFGPSVSLFLKGRFRMTDTNQLTIDHDETLTQSRVAEAIDGYFGSISDLLGSLEHFRIDPKPIESDLERLEHTFLRLFYDITTRAKFDEETTGWNLPKLWEYRKMYVDEEYPRKFPESQSTGGFLMTLASFAFAREELIASLRESLDPESPRIRMRTRSPLSLSRTLDDAIPRIRMALTSIIFRVLDEFEWVDKVAADGLRLNLSQYDPFYRAIVEFEPND